MILLRSLLFYIAFWSWTLVLGIAALPSLLSARWSAQVPGLWVRGALWLLASICGLRVEIRGREHLQPGAAIYASKHQSALDTLALWQLLGHPVFILKRELLRIPVFGWYLARTQPIAIDRGARGQALQAIAQQGAVQAVAGRPIVIFPEGTRTAPGACVPYKTGGISVLYSQLGLPVVPVALNTGLFWGRNALLKKPGVAVIELLPPIEAGMETAKMLAILKERIESHLTVISPSAGMAKI